MRITFKQIEIFIAIAKQENMSLAAEELHLSQSACSMALSNLEEQLTEPLFDRYGKKLVLNERGRILFPKALNIIAQVRALQSDMMNNKIGTMAGHLILGASTTIGNYLMPTIIADFYTRCPEVKITLSIANTETIIEQLLKFQIDMGFVEGSCYANNIEVIPWKTDELIVIASPKHPLAKKRKITLNDLQHVNWILRERGSGTREKFENVMHGKINSYVEMGHTEAIKQATKVELGISCLSRTVVKEELKHRELIELKTPFLKLSREFYLLLHKEKYQTSVLREFIKNCQNSADAKLHIK